MEYLLGNHVIAEAMFRHDPRALLYAPLRLLLYSDADGNAVFSMDRSSWAFEPGSESVESFSCRLPWEKAHQS